MYKYSFYNDYSEGCHPKILEFLASSNLIQEAGYGEDAICVKARELLKTKIANSKVDIHFVSAGTQVNLIMLAAMMRPYESVIAVETAHINVHEAGAIEATGHKINLVQGIEGKITIEKIDEVVKAHHDEHMVKPKMVFISNSTELGTVYNKEDLVKISKYCHENNLYLYLDGARLGMALTSEGIDLTLKDIAELVDAFYIGGTKNGALLGEAIVICNENLKKDFRYFLKQRGGLLAKGRVLGAQFLVLFQDDLYFELAKHANAMAAKLSEKIRKLGFKFLTEAKTNQIFPILPNAIIEKLREIYGFYVWAKADEGNSAIRLVTSWSTNEKMVDEFIRDLNTL